MLYKKIFQDLQNNKPVFFQLLQGKTKEEYTWKQSPEKWCLLEIVCHLYDEEREDFRARTRHVLETPDLPMPGIDPVKLVTERKYMEQDYEMKLKQFMEERDQSVNWLNGLQDPHWDNFYVHPKFGKLAAKMFLYNWLAHDYLHFRQITRLNYDYLKQVSGESLDYAGTW